MKTTFSKLCDFRDRFTRLRQIMPTSDALRLSMPKARPRELEIYLTPIKHSILLRRGSSDLSCLQNVFLDQEYTTPFQVDPRVIVDGGANIGMTTLFFSRKYPQAKIVAIEPESSNFEILKKNCRGLSNVILVHAALWPVDEDLVIHDPNIEKWAFSVTAKKNGSRSEQVKAITIPSLLRQLGLQYIDILKLDIEGAERELFNEGAESWLGSVGQIIIELHDRIVYGCASAFYSKIAHYPFSQATRADNVFINFKPCV
jgi:FkbM family methyltransferase